MSAPSTTGAPSDVDVRLIQDQPGIKGALSGLRRRLSQGELGNIPVIVGIVIIWTIFQLRNDRFLSAFNLTNLMLQIAAMGMISAGLVLVLLLGEIDLSAGSVSGLTAAIMAVLNVNHGWPAPVAIGTAIVAGLSIGLFQGFWVAKLRVPSFIVTLAGLLGWQGVLLYVLGTTGTVNLRDATITGLANTFFKGATAWIIVGVVLAAYIAASLLGRARRVSAGLLVPPLTGTIVRIVVVSVLAVVAVAVFNTDRGIPLATLILIGFIFVLDLLTRRTRFGRHIFAVGGNAEASRRAGIRVDGVRIVVFGLCSTMAACGGILAASRLLAVNQSSGGSDLLLNCVAAAVIGGTSLFGGRGSAWSALLGALVIGSISNGMDLLALDSSVKFMITGAVLLLAATIDATSRRGRESAGRA